MHSFIQKPPGRRGHRAFGPLKPSTKNRLPCYNCSAVANSQLPKREMTEFVADSELPT